MKLTTNEIEARLSTIPGWSSIDDIALSREYEFDDFATALAFVNRVGEICETYNHHPDINLSYGNVSLLLATHDEDGVTEKDFVLATALKGLEDAL